MHKTTFILLAIFFITFRLYSQTPNELIVTDTIHKNELITKHVYYEHCPGFISGLSCVRYLEYVGDSELKRKFIDVKGEKIYYQLTKEDTVVIALPPYFRLKFDRLEINKDNPSKSHINDCKKKKSKWCGSDAIYTDVMYYVGKVKTEYLNKIFYSNIMINTLEEYVNVYLIYN